MVLVVLRIIINKKISLWFPNVKSGEAALVDLSLADLITLKKSIDKTSKRGLI